MKGTLFTPRILSAFNLLKRVGFAVLVWGGYLTTQAQPYELQFLYDEVSDEPWPYGQRVLAPLGDQDGDGFDDILTCEWDGTGYSYHLKIIYGAAEPPYEYLAFAHTMLDTSAQQYFWQQLEPYTSCGDYNGDGHTDIMVELRRHPDAQSRMYLYLGGPALFDTLWDWAASDFTGLKSFGNYGDYNADGYDDFICSTVSGSTNRRFRFYESFWLTQSQEPTWTYGYGETIDEPYPSGPGNYGDINGDGDPDFTFTGTVDLVPNDPVVTDSIYQDFWFGGPDADSIPGIHLRYSGQSSCVAGFEPIGDVNGDGIDDLIGHTLVPGLHGPIATDNRVYYGGDPLDLVGVDVMWETPTLYFIASGAQLLGDINGDGYEDVAFNQGNPPDGGGILYVFLGGNLPPTRAAFILEGYWEGFRLALNLSRAGDFNGDGLDDWMFTSSQDAPPPEGSYMRLSIVSGDPDFGLDVPTDRPSIAREIALSIFPNPFNSTLRISLDAPLHADVSVSLYDLLGREVDVIYRGRLSSSTISYVAPAGLASGVYFVRAESGAQASLVKVVLLK
ncbi:MAG: T9SS type A sorting domain-containing protein [Calditrichaeota bacterium]|nr:T9SS type A sorting domain-containing protein [Calditrichota bacterium]MCB9369083.1 T9SS type A sorting domain-containing protein [Calditrichota bacterium]